MENPGIKQSMYLEKEVQFTPQENKYIEDNGIIVDLLDEHLYLDNR